MSSNQINKISLAEMINRLKLKVVYKTKEVNQTFISNIMASDLMSDVLMIGSNVELLVTSLATDQVMRTAHIMDMVGVIIVNDKEITENMKDLAREFKINLFSSGLTKYEACCALYDLQKGIN